MDFNFAKDIISIREILGLTQDELARELGTQRVTISRSELDKTKPSDNLLEKFYSYVFKQGIEINRLKEMYWKEKLETDHILLFHGAKDVIEGDISVTKGRVVNDFGPGFYTGESFTQAAAFVSGFERSSVYIMDFFGEKLKEKRYRVDQEWMLTIAYYRGTLEEYRDHPFIQKIVKKSRECDYIVAPIADNRMFNIINSFIAGEITDEQCKHCLAATNLGHQYVFISDRAVKNIKLLERCYVAGNEKEHFRGIRTNDARLGENKVKLARREYRGKGKYIDEILE